MTSPGEKLFGWLVALYPRSFRERYREDLVAFFQQDREHPKYGSGLFRPLRFWIATVVDLVRSALRLRRTDGSHPVDPARRRSPWGGRLRQDLLFAWRGLRAAPGVAFSALAVLTLGIGAGTAVFSVVDAVALRGLPFPDDGRIMSVAETDLPSGRPTVVAPQNYADWRARQHVFANMGAITSGPAFTTRDEPIARIRVIRTTASLFDVLDVKPARGRLLGVADERPDAPPVAIISDRLWRGRFNGDPLIIGRPIASSTDTFTIVGVMPPGFTYPISSLVLNPVDIWIPFVPTSAMSVRGNARNYNLSVIARLKPDVSIKQASTEMKQIRDALAAETPAWFDDKGVIVRPLQDALVSGSVRAWMLLLLGAVAVVVLMACLNAANLLVARAVGRAPELAVRTALGASRRDLARSLFVESLMMTLLGTAGGVLLALWGVEILRNALPANVPRLATVALDFRVLSMSVIAALATGLIFGTIPALQASRPDVIALIRQGGRSHSGSRGGRRLRAGLVIAEVALAVVLLSGSGLFLASFMRVTSVDLGFNPAHVVGFLNSTMSSELIHPAQVPEARQQAIAGQSIVADAIARVRAVPGVAAAAPVQGGTPLSGSYLTVEVAIDGRTEQFTGADEAAVRSVGPGYLDVLRGVLERGRWIAETDLLGTTPVVVLSDAAAHRYFGARDPVGQRLWLRDYPRQIVGVVRSMRWQGPESPLVPEVFIPYAQTAHPTAHVLVRTHGDPVKLIPEIQAAIQRAMPAVAIGAPAVLERSYAGLIEHRRFNMIILLVFGLVAVAIAAIGIYGIMAFLVAQRRREIGVRVALGAQRSGIFRIVLGGAFKLMIAGLIPGILVALLLERTARDFLFNATPHDPAIYALVAAGLLATGLAAALGPARRATRVDPLVSLRLE